MGALATEFEATYSEERVKQLSNPDAGHSASKDSGRITKAETWATERFERKVQIAFDSTDQSHLNIGCLYMEAILVQWGAGSSKVSAGLIKAADDEAADMAGTEGGRGRFNPDSQADEVYKEDRVTRDGATTYPWSSHRHFRGIIPKEVGGDDD